MVNESNSETRFWQSHFGASRACYRRFVLALGHDYLAQVCASVAALIGLEERNAQYTTDPLGLLHVLMVTTTAADVSSVSAITGRLPYYYSNTSPTLLMSTKSVLIQGTQDH